ncbi:MAG: hypothetical protein ACXADS_07680 [Candidatus Thorarchaeota archaeon]|jgi:hypothetical protein
MVSIRQRNTIVVGVLTWLVLLPALGGTIIADTPLHAKSYISAAPIIDSPSDVSFENGSLGHTIEWHPDDPNPKNYTVTRNGTVHSEEIWNGEIITVFLNHLYWDGLLDEPSEIPSVHEYVCTVFNENNESASDTVIVNVVPDESAPFIAQPEDIEYEEGSFGHTIQWNITESNTDFYNITRTSSDPASNNTAIEGGDWLFPNITISVDGLNSTHWYLYTLFVNDTFGRNSTSSVNVTVKADLTEPAVTGPGNISFEFGEDGHEIIWHVYDSNPENYTVNVTIIDDDTGYGDPSDPLMHSPLDVVVTNWTLVSPTGDDVSYSLENVFLGNYSFTIILFDKSGRNSTHSLNVSIFEDIRAPIVTSPDSFSYEEGYTGYSLEWSAEENNPISYNLTRNGELILEGAWSGANISIGVDGLPVGAHQHNITFTDFFNQSSSALVTVTVLPDAVLPVVSQVQIIQAYSTVSANNITVQAYAWDLNVIGNITVEWYTTDETAIDELDMTLFGDDLYEARLGRFQHSVVIHYRVTAKDNSSVQNEFVTEWREFEVTPLTREGLPLLFIVVVAVLGGLSTVVVLVLYFRTRTR